MRSKFNCCFGGLLVLGSIVLWGCAAKKVSVRKTPSVQGVYTYQEQVLLAGYPNQAKPWVVFTDKEGASVYPDQKSEGATSRSKRFDPYVVLKKKGSRYQLAKYEAGSLANGKLDRARAKTAVWIEEKDLLLWTDALRNARDGFRLKGLLALHDSSLMDVDERSMKNDSVLVYKDPNLVEKATLKLPLNSLVYLYKFSADKKRVLLGGRSKIEVDNPTDQLYGWVDTRMVSVWGARTAFRLPSTPQAGAIQLGMQYDTLFTPVVSSSPIRRTLDLTQLYPLIYKKGKADFVVNYLDQVLDFRENRVYNVDGNAISYSDYQCIVRNQRKLNIVFVIDGSDEVRAHMQGLKAVFQSWSKPLSGDAPFQSITYSTLFYHVEPKYAAKHAVYTQDLDTWLDSFDNPTSQEGGKEARVSLNETMEGVRQRLISKESESNLVVVLGQHLTDKDRDSAPDLVARMGETRSRFIFYQTHADRRDATNDFVLYGEEFIQATAQVITKNKRQRLVNHEAILSATTFDLKQGDQGLYQLDYPLNSAHQGAVIFPKKGEENKPMLFQKTLEKMLQDMAVDNQEIDCALTFAFRSEKGMARTRIKKEYLPWYPQKEPYVAASIGMQLFDQPYSFVNEGVVRKKKEAQDLNLEYGVLLDEGEWEELRDYYLLVHAKVFKNKLRSNRAMIRRYITVAKEKGQLPRTKSRKFWRTHPMSTGLFLSTGLYETDLHGVATLNLQQWKRKEIVDSKALERFFEEFKAKANQMEANKASEKSRLIQHNTVLYWLDQTYIPKLDLGVRPSNLPTTIENSKDQLPSNKGLNEEVQEYLKRVKKGMP